MHAVLQALKAHPVLGPALIAPAAIMLLFAFFNLTAAPDGVHMADRLVWPL